MTSSLQYKFKSQLKYAVLHFDGDSISLADVKERIMTEKRMQKANDYDLEVTNANTGEIFTSADTMIPRNSALSIRRQPMQRLPAVKSDLSKEEQELTDLAFSKLTKTADLARASAPESDKIKAMMKQSNVDFDPSLYQKILPSNYVCFRCGVKGHFIRNCPTLGDSRYNLPSKVNSRQPQISRELLNMRMQEEDRLINRLRLQHMAPSLGPVVGSDLLLQGDLIPTDLQCPVCSSIFEDCVITPCCGRSYCDKCIRSHLVDNDCVCPGCNDKVSPDNLIENRSVRKSVSNFRNKSTAMAAVPTLPSQPLASSIVTQSVTESVKPVVPASSTALSDPSISSTQESSQDINDNSVSTTTPSAGDPKSSDDTKEESVEGEAQIDFGVVKVTTASTVQSAVVAPAEALPAGSTTSVANTAVHMLPIATSKVGSTAAALLPAAAGQVIIQPGMSVAGLQQQLHQQQLIQQQQVQIQLLQQQMSQQQLQQQIFYQPQTSLIRVTNPPGVHLPPGHQVIKRLVPVPVTAAATSARLSAPTVAAQLPQQVEAAPLIAAKLPSEKIAPDHSSTADKDAGSATKEDSSQMPMSKEEFYIWQRTVLEEKQRKHEVIDLCETSPKKSRHRRSTSREREKHGRSKSPKRSRTGKEKHAEKDVDPERAQKKKEKLAALDEYRRKKKIPERIQRELDEFEFDNELEFDEELKRLKLKDRERRRKEKKIKRSEKYEEEELSADEKHSKSSRRVLSPDDADGIKKRETRKNRSRDIKKMKDRNERQAESSSSSSSEDSEEENDRSIPEDVSSSKRNEKNGTKKKQMDNIDKIIKDCDLKAIDNAIKESEDPDAAKKALTKELDTAVQILVGAIDPNEEKDAKKATKETLPSEADSSVILPENSRWETNEKSKKQSSKIKSKTIQGKKSNSETREKENSNGIAIDGKLEKEVDRNASTDIKHTTESAMTEEQSKTCETREDLETDNHINDKSDQKSKSISEKSVEKKGERNEKLLKKKKKKESVEENTEIENENPDKNKSIEDDTLETDQDISKEKIDDEENLDNRKKSESQSQSDTETQSPTKKSTRASLKSKLANVRKKITIEEKLIKLASKSSLDTEVKRKRALQKEIANQKSDSSIISDMNQSKIEKQKEHALKKMNMKRIKEGKKVMTPEQELKIGKLLEEKMIRKKEAKRKLISPKKGENTEEKARSRSSEQVLSKNDSNSFIVKDERKMTLNKESLPKIPGKGIELSPIRDESWKSKELPPSPEESCEHSPKRGRSPSTREIGKQTKVSRNSSTAKERRKDSPSRELSKQSETEKRSVSKDDNARSPARKADKRRSLSEEESPERSEKKRNSLERESRRRSPIKAGRSVSPVPKQDRNASPERKRKLKRDRVVDGEESLRKARKISPSKSDKKRSHSASPPSRNSRRSSVDKRTSPSREERKSKKKDRSESLDKQKFSKERGRRIATSPTPLRKYSPASNDSRERNRSESRDNLSSNRERKNKKRERSESLEKLSKDRTKVKRSEVSLKSRKSDQELYKPSPSSQVSKLKSISDQSKKLLNESSKDKHDLRADIIKSKVTAVKKPLDRDLTVTSTVIDSRATSSRRIVKYTDDEFDLTLTPAKRKTVKNIELSGSEEKPEKKRKKESVTVVLDSDNEISSDPQDDELPSTSEKDEHLVKKKKKSKDKSKKKKKKKSKDDTEDSDEEKLRRKHKKSKKAKKKKKKKKKKKMKKKKAASSSSSSDEAADGEESDAVEEGDESEDTAVTSADEKVETEKPRKKKLSTEESESELDYDDDLDADVDDGMDFVDDEQSSGRTLVKEGIEKQESIEEGELGDDAMGIVSTGEVEESEQLEEDTENMKLSKDDSPKDDSSKETAEDDGKSDQEVVDEKEGEADPSEKDATALA